MTWINNTGTPSIHDRWSKVFWVDQKDFVGIEERVAHDGFTLEGVQTLVKHFRPEWTNAFGTHALIAAWHYDIVQRRLLIQVCGENFPEVPPGECLPVEPLVPKPFEWTTVVAPFERESVVAEGTPCPRCGEQPKSFQQYGPCDWRIEHHCKMLPTGTLWFYGVTRQDVLDQWEEACRNIPQRSEDCDEWRVVKPAGDIVQKWQEKKQLKAALLKEFPEANDLIDDYLTFIEGGLPAILPKPDVVLYPAREGHSIHIDEDGGVEYKPDCTCPTHLLSLGCPRLTGAQECRKA